MLEGLIVFAVITGILLPVRLFFVAYVSDNWFGSFGVIGAISILLLTLAKKDKLGKFGQMFNRQIEKFQHGKKAIQIGIQKTTPYQPKAGLICLLRKFKIGNCHSRHFFMICELRIDESY